MTMLQNLADACQVYVEQHPTKERAEMLRLIQRFSAYQWHHGLMMALLARCQCMQWDSERRHMSFEGKANEVIAEMRGLLTVYCLMIDNVNHGNLITQADMFLILKNAIADFGGALKDASEAMENFGKAWEQGQDDSESEGE